VAITRIFSVIIIAGLVIQQKISRNQGKALIQYLPSCRILDKSKGMDRVQYDVLQISHTKTKH